MRGDAVASPMPEKCTEEVKSVAMAFGELVGKKALEYLKVKGESDGQAAGVMKEVRTH